MKRVLPLLLALGVPACSAAAPHDPGPGHPVAACGLSAAALGQFVAVPAGQFRRGSYPLYPEETSDMIVHLGAFEMLAHEVTNAEFMRFVEASGYVTSAERSAASGEAGAGSAVFRMPGSAPSVADPWALVAGATWRAPEGPGSDIEGLAMHPVVHVSLADARAYAAWAGSRLPSEEEWEYAAAIGLPDPADPQSGAYAPGGLPVANTWQGVFPLADEGVDGIAGRASAGCFPPSAIGLYDIIGNVWEWTETPFGEGTQVIKGGSYLCSDNFCRRYRPAARQSQEADFSSGHIGFRIVRDERTE